MKPHGWDKPIPPNVRCEYRGRIYWAIHWAGTGLWTVEPDDDIARMVRSGGNWMDAIDEYEVSL